MLLRISKGGQVSIPAPIRKRWKTNDLVAEDHGDKLVLRPAPDDPIDRAYGAFKHLFEGTSARAEFEKYKEEELEIEEEKWRRYSTRKR
jgi:bifunctional DNA-binding transcriptional regulator/antitoxin component of YhaV-PrlF toxin-antitoxin module